MNNSLIFEYPTSEESISNIPIPTGELTTNKVYRGTRLPEGFYTVESLEESLTASLNQILHKNEFTDVTPGTPHDFYVDIDPETQKVKLINRIEACPVFAMQTILDPVEDIFASFVTGPTGTDIVQGNCFYVVYKKELDSDNGFPLVITDSGGIGNLSITDINCVTFFEVMSGLAEGLNYEFFDQLLIGGINYYRYRFCGDTFTVNASENRIYRRAGGNWDKILDGMGIFNYVLDEGVLARVGRGLPFALFYQRSQLTTCLCQSSLDTLNEDGSINTVLGILGFNVQNDEVNLEDPTPPTYQYIWSNKDSYTLSSTSFSSTVNDNVGQAFPNNLLDLEYADGKYFFRSEDYIFLRLVVMEDQKELGNQLILAGPIETPDNQPTDIYYNTAINGQIAESERLQRKSLDQLFAKIDLDPVPGNNTNSVAGYISNNLDFKNEQLNTLSEIGVQFLDREGRLLNLRADNHFVLQIIEKRNVLDNVLLNTQQG